MSLTALMIEQIGAARTIVEDGAEVVPVWRINSPEGSYLVFTRFDHDKPEKREGELLLRRRRGARRTEVGGRCLAKCPVRRNPKKLARVQEAWLRTTQRWSW